MATASHSGKLIIFILVALVGGAAGCGYFKQTASLDSKPKEETAENAPQIDRSVLAAKPNDIILGDANALVTIVEYSSLSCPHCAHFHDNVLPQLDKEFITSGKAKLVMRYFPLNEPAIKASAIVECAGNAGLKRENFLKVLFSMQPQWAFSEGYVGDLKKIALTGGMDSAVFDSCLSDAAVETSILNTRQEAADKLGVTSTPTFFINGEKMAGDVAIESFRKAIEEAEKNSK